MQAEYTGNRGNGFIISPSEAGAPSKKTVARPVEAVNRLSDVKDVLSDAADTCASYAKSSAKEFSRTVISAVVAVCCIFGIFHFFTFATGIYCNGSRIASADGREDFLSALAAAKTVAASCGIDNFDASFSTSPVIELRSKVMPVAPLRDKILVSSGLFTEGCSLYIGSDKIFNAENTDIARTAVEKYISAYSMDGNASLSAEPIYKTVIIPKSEISDGEECVKLLEANGTVSVVSVVNVTSSQAVPYETYTEDDSSMYIGETLTVTEGKNGNMQVSQETVYENGEEQSSRISSEKITAQPVNQVVKVGTKYKKVLESGLIYPLQGILSSPFGERWGSVHEGIDIAVDEGTPVKAAECGKVAYVSETSSGYGKLIRIDHGYGVQTAYAHLSEIQVSVGQSVAAGSVIGLSGNTGRSTGPHLHFEITQDGTPVDPLKYLK